MWQLHLLYNIQNATYLKSETDIHLYSELFSCYFFVVVFNILKQEQKQCCPANRFNRYFRDMIFKDKILEEKKYNKMPQHRNSTRGNSTARDLIRLHLQG